MRRKFIIACIMALFVGANVPSALVYAENDQSTGHKILYVDDDYNETTPGYGEYKFSKIQDAINKAPDGCKIIVYEGVYNEHLDITKRKEGNKIMDRIISIIGEDKHRVILKPPKDYAIKISSGRVTIDGLSMDGRRNIGKGIYILVGETEQYVRRVDIRNCIISNFTEAGIFVDNERVDLVTIDGCKLVHNGRGVYARKGNVDMITFCEISKNAEDGICLERARVCTIEKNIISNNGGFAISIKSSPYEGLYFINNNHIEGNDKGAITTTDNNDYLIGMFIKWNNFIENGDNNKIYIITECRYLSAKGKGFPPIVYFKENYWEPAFPKSIKIKWGPFSLEGLRWYQTHPTGKEHAKPPVDP